MVGDTVDDKIGVFLNDFYELKEEGAKNNIDVFFGLEISLKNDHYHGNNFLCAELLIYGIAVQEFIENNIKIYNMSYKELYSYAEDKGWIIVQAHPYRLRTKRVSCKYLHGIEVFYGHPGHNSSNSLALNRAVKHKLIKISGSDFHFKGGENSGIMLDTPVKDEKHLVELLKGESYYCM